MNLSKNPIKHITVLFVLVCSDWSAPVAWSGSTHHHTSFVLAPPLITQLFYFPSMDFCWSKVLWICWLCQRWGWLCLVTDSTWGSGFCPGGQKVSLSVCNSEFVYYVFGVDDESMQLLHSVGSGPIATLCFPSELIIKVHQALMGLVLTVSADHITQQRGCSTQNNLSRTSSVKNLICNDKRTVVMVTV